MRSTAVLSEAVGSTWPVPHSEPFLLLDVIRLDDVAEVSSEANRLQLENPDFLLIGKHSSSARPVLQAADAKFAADRIKASQVSAVVVSNLIDVPNGFTRALVRERVEALGLLEPTIVRGVFVVPESELTEHHLNRVAQGRNPTVDRAEVVTIPPDPGSMFSGLPQSRAIGPLARIDALPVTPRTNLISAIYYFRLSCACFYLWNEQQRPLLATASQAEPEPGIVVAEIARRADQVESAYDLAEAWAADIEPLIKAREAVTNVATLPIRMRDVRARVEQAGTDGDNRKLRHVRRALEMAFRTRLIEEVGTIASDDPRPLPEILDVVARTSRALAGEMNALLTESIARASDVDATNGSNEDTS